MGSLPKINNRACVAVNTVLSKCTMNNPMRLLRSTSREVKKKNSSLWKKWTRWAWMKKIVIYKAQLANPVTAVTTVATARVDTARVDTAVDMVATARVEVSAAATRAW